jgi:hypothetical protein
MIRVCRNRTTLELLTSAQNLDAKRAARSHAVTERENASRVLLGKAASTKGQLFTAGSMNTLIANEYTRSASAGRWESLKSNPRAECSLRDMLREHPPACDRQFSCQLLFSLGPARWRRPMNPHPYRSNRRRTPLVRLRQGCTTRLQLRSPVA